MTKKDEIKESARRAERIKEINEGFDANENPELAKMLAEIEKNNKKFKDK